MFFLTKVPKFKMYFPSVNDMNIYQKVFYYKWLINWQCRRVININGQISYLFVYIYSLLETKKYKFIIKKLTTINKYYGHYKDIKHSLFILYFR